MAASSFDLVYRDALVTHDPRYWCIGPSLTFATIAPPSSITKNVTTTESRQLYDMGPSPFSAYNRDRCNEFRRASYNSPRPEHRRGTSARNSEKVTMLWKDDQQRGCLNRG
jgi:hypothetical protein